MLTNELSKFGSFPSQQQVLVLPHVVSAHLNYLDSARSSLATDKSWLAPNSREAHLTYRRRTEKKQKCADALNERVAFSCLGIPTDFKQEGRQTLKQLAG